jgi:predicted acetyltransferase
VTSEPELRQVAPEDKLPWLRTMRTGLMVDPSMSSEVGLAWWDRIWQPDRITGAYADGRCVGTLRTFGTPLSVPIGEQSCADIPIDALTQVSVAATHRRQGLLRRMLSQSLADAKERGEVASLLRAAEWPIYGRFGYAPASFASNYTIWTATKPQILPPTSDYQVVQVEQTELLEPARTVLAAIRRQRQGQIDRSEAYWQRRMDPALRMPGSREPVCVIARNPDGGVDGYATWVGKDGDWFHDPLQQSQARVTEVLASTPDAYRALWGYLLSIDLVRLLELEAYPVDEPLEWLIPDGRLARRTWTGDNDWLRLLDVPVALSTRRYSSTDRLVLDVIDTDGGWAQGRVRLDGGPEHAECTPAPQDGADLTLSQRALASIYLGGCTVRSQQLAGLVDEHTAGAAERLAAMFRTGQAPWNVTPF